MTLDILRAEKVALRTALLSARHACGDGHSSELISLVERHGFKRVAAYANFGAEPSTQTFLDWAVEAGIEVLLPRVANDTELDWHRYQANRLGKGSLGIPEPTGLSETLEAVQLIIAPAIAVGLDGSRLGRGKGYYDRVLAEVSCPKVALVHNTELFDSVPHEQHDSPVDAVITCSATRLLNERLN